MRKVAGALLLVSLASGAYLVATIGTAARYLADSVRKPEPAAGRIDVAARDGALRFTVGRVRCGATQVGTRRLGQRARGEFCMVPIAVTNVSATACFLPAGSQHAFDADGVAFTPDGAAALYADDRNRKLLETIEPGHRVRGTLVYDVPTAGRLASIVLHGTEHSPGVRIPLRSVASGDD
ncbi:DUF4352 domain-containing protein [Actinoplanes sp. NPDC051494]|uniref:DUF4352 domain-containing protein n=1 Tax=Actinoplanes sp. NPDC051494 TaxID=3363907 RepID=UPI0037B9733C